jgi:hypothetical protein
MEEYKIKIVGIGDAIRDLEEAIEQETEDGWDDLAEENQAYIEKLKSMKNGVVVHNLREYFDLLKLIEEITFNDYRVHGTTIGLYE